MHLRQKFITPHSSLKYHHSSLITSLLISHYSKYPKNHLPLFCTLTRSWFSITKTPKRRPRYLTYTTPTICHPTRPLLRPYNPCRTLPNPQKSLHLNPKQHPLQDPSTLPPPLKEGRSTLKKSRSKCSGVFGCGVAHHRLGSLGCLWPMHWSSLSVGYMCSKRKRDIGVIVLSLMKRVVASAIKSWALCDFPLTMGPSNVCLFTKMPWKLNFHNLKTPKMCFQFY